MDSDQRQRAENAILGALAADSATMGLHWIYSQRRIAELAPEMPEFRVPDEADYEGGVGYFAHGGKKAGDYSHYGEQMLVMLHSLTQTGGCYEKAHYQESFRRHFGYGGDFTGYIDRPTRQTLDKIYADENAALAAVDRIPFEGDPREKQSMLTKVLAAVKRLDGERLKEQVTRYAADAANPELSLGFGLALVDALAGSDAFPGALDEQLPAVSKLPPLIACHVEDSALSEIAESAIRVTNNAPRALEFGRVCTALLAAAVRGESMVRAIDAALAAGSADTRELLNRGLAMKVPSAQMAREFGLHCDLGAGVPIILHVLKNATTYEEAVRSNIYIGGDNCGRAIVLGAVCGAVFGRGGEAGIPESWLARMRDSTALAGEVAELLASVG